MEYSSDVLIENLRLEDGKICFHATGKKGNLTVYADDGDGRVLWSWHLWFTDMPAEKCHTVGHNSQYILMDRNLGATSADPDDGIATYGLYYQWGRKDPFSYTDFRGGLTTNPNQTIETGIRRPYRPLSNNDYYAPDWVGTYNDYLWGNPEFRVTNRLEDLTKTIYDPCPVGYMVPPAQVFGFMSQKEFVSFVENGFFVRGDYGQLDFYPFAGNVTASSYNAYGIGIGDACTMLWHSCAARYFLRDNDAGACTKVDKASEFVEFKSPLIRAGGAPVRCVKQMTAE